MFWLAYLSLLPTTSLAYSKGNDVTGQLVPICKDADKQINDVSIPFMMPVGGRKRL